MSYKNIFRFVSVLTFAAAILLALPSCKKKTQKKPFVPGVTVMKVYSEELPIETIAVGQISPIEKVQLVARVQGYLTKRNFEAGSFVKKGQLLFEIQKEEYRADCELATAQLIQAQANYDFSLVEYNRYKLLETQNAASRETLDLTIKNKYLYDAAIRQAKANLALSNLNLSYTDITAPFDGRIGMYNYSAGDLVGLNSGALAEVIMTNPIWVEFNYSESFFIKRMKELGNKALPNFENPNINTGDRVFVKLILSEGSEYPLEGKINFIDNKIDTESGTIKIKAIFENPDQLLVPGGYVQVKIGLRKKVSHMLIPQSSVQSDQQGTFVFVVNTKDTIEKKYISVGTAVGINIVVNSGLNVGDLVVTQGLLLVRQGSLVKYVLQGQTAVDSAVSSDTPKAAKN